MEMMYGSETSKSKDYKELYKALLSINIKLELSRLFEVKGNKNPEENFFRIFLCYQNHDY